MSYTDNVEDRRFRESVHASLPQHALHHNRTKLVQSEWTCKVRAPEELSRQGGIALVPKSLVPQVLAAVGTTMQPVAMLTSQPAWELHLKGYSSSQVTCALQTVGEQGAVVYMESQRWLTQLGEGKPVTMEIDGLAVVDECITMAKMTFTFDTTEGWKHLPPAVCAAHRLWSDHCAREWLHGYRPCFQEPRGRRSASQWFASRLVQTSCRRDRAQLRGYLLAVRYHVQGCDGLRSEPEGEVLWGSEEDWWRGATLWHPVLRRGRHAGLCSGARVGRPSQAWPLQAYRSVTACRPQWFEADDAFRTQVAALRGPLPGRELRSSLSCDLPVYQQDGATQSWRDHHM